MKYYEVEMIGKVGAWADILTYTSDHDLSVGQVVEVPVGANRTSLGIVRREDKHPATVNKKGQSISYKAILRVVYKQPLPDSLLELHDWMTSYYATSSGITWQTILPSRLNRKRIKDYRPDVKATKTPDSTLLLNSQQEHAVQQILSTPSGTTLLHGITGSGKTNVYKAVARQIINDGRSVIILVPEISLTTQLVQEFQKEFNNVVVTHSAMKDSERVILWHYILNCTEPIVIVGPRSALFMPVRNLGLVVVDECHEPSYKQEQAPRYSTTVVASRLTQLAHARLILGSATPSISDYYLAQRLGKPIIELNQLARADAKRPTTEIIDLTRRDNFSTESYLFSKPLLTAMRETLKQRRQILLFHNRRGSASTTICQDCGWIASCPSCYLPLTLHNDKFALICHLCGYKQRPPLKCPECDSANIKSKGIGTKRIEDEVKKLFPSSVVRRFDGDTEKGFAVQDLYDELKSGTIQIIIGTQTIAKGLDLPNLALVGVVQADAGLAMPDFSASERTFQLVAQVCGRVGRSNIDTKAIIQTYQPDAAAVRYGATQDYLGFYNYEIAQRQKGHFPPLAYLLKLTCTYKTERGAATASRRLASELRQKFGTQIYLLGPAPAFYERLRGLYTWQIVIRAPRRDILIKVSECIPTSWQLELDPNSLIS